MCRALFAIALISLLACGRVVAAETPSTDPGASPAVQNTTPAPKPRARTVKRVQKTPGDGHAAAGSLPLSAAAAYASEHAASLPLAPASRPAPAPTQTWTGFYIGAGAGVGTTQP
jgi:hypothetical protein